MVNQQVNRQARRAREKRGRARMAAIRAPAPPPRVSWESVRMGAQKAAEEKGEWAGAPLPADGVPLVLEKRYPFPDLNGLYMGKHWRTGRLHKHECRTIDHLLDAAEFVCKSDDVKPVVVVNEWYARWRGWDCKIYIWHDGDRRAKLSVDLTLRRKEDMLLYSIAAAHAIKPEAEETAMALLKTLITDAQWKSYLITGAFLESSKRSNGAYLFRRCRPTIALRPCGRNKIRAITALCMHPIGHYEGTWVGVMAPTDDVIAHLLFMRADEPGYWRRCNQHPLDAPESGL